MEVAKDNNSLVVKIGYKCSKCGIRQKLHVHHLNYDRLGNELQSDLMVVCNNCHNWFHENIYSQKN